MKCHGRGKTNVTELTRLRSEAAPVPVAPMMPLLPALEDIDGLDVSYICQDLDSGSGGVSQIVMWCCGRVVVSTLLSVGLKG